VRPRSSAAPPPEPAAAADAAPGVAAVSVAVPAGIFSGLKFLIGRKGEYRVGGKLYDNAARLARLHGAILVDSVHDATYLIIDRAVEPEAAVGALLTLR